MKEELVKGSRNFHRTSFTNRNIRSRENNRAKVCCSGSTDVDSIVITVEVRCRGNVNVAAIADSAQRVNEEVLTQHPCFLIRLHSHL